MDLAPSETSANIPAAMVELKSPEIDYDVKALLHSQTYYQSVRPRNGNPTHTILANNTTETRFRVEKGVYNFSEFVLSFDASIQQHAATDYIHMFGSVLPIQSIQVRGEKNNAVLMDVADMNIYGTQVPKFETSHKEYKFRSNRDTLYPSQLVRDENSRYEATAIVPLAEYPQQNIEVIDDLGRKGEKKAGGAPTDEPELVEWYGDVDTGMVWPTTQTVIIPEIPRHASSDEPASVPYYEHQYVYKTIGPNGAEAVIPLASKSIRFGDVFKNSILAYNKLFPATEPIEIVIRWCASSGWGFESKSGSDYATAPADLTKNISLTNLALHMSQEQPHTYVYKKCVEMAEVNPEGLVLSTPMITAQEGRAYQSTQTTVPFFLSNGMGKKISKIIVVPTGGAPVGNLRYDFDNTAGSKIEWYWSKFNNQTIQPAQVDCVATDLDYQQNRKRLLDSPLGNFDVYRYNWAIYEDFSGCGNAPHAEYAEDSLFVGKDATSRDTFELKIKTGAVGAAGLILKTFFVGTQRVHITRNGIRVL